MLSFKPTQRENAQAFRNLFKHKGMVVVEIKGNSNSPVVTLRKLYFVMLKINIKGYLQRKVKLIIGMSHMVKCQLWN